MMVSAQFRQKDSGNTLVIPVQLSHTLHKLRLMWGEKSRFDHQWFYFTDVDGQPIPEEGFVGDIIKPRSSGIDIYVEELRPIKVHLVGFPHKSTSFPVALSTKCSFFIQYICERLVLPDRRMMLRSSSGILDLCKSLADNGITEGSEVIADFQFLIHVTDIGDINSRRTIQCYASHCAEIILHPEIGFEKQRLYFESTMLKTDGKVIDALRNIGGLYWMEWDLSIDREMTVHLIYPRLCEKTQKCSSYTKQVWHMDQLKVVFEGVTEERLVWQNKAVPLTQTFFEAGIVDGSRISIETILRLRVVDFSGTTHLMHVPDTDTVGDVREKMQQFMNKRFFHLKFKESYLYPDNRVLKFFGVESDSVIELQSKEIPHLVVYNNEEYDIGILDEHATFRTIISQCDGVVPTPFDVNTYFECDCLQIISSQVEEPHSALCSTVPRRLTAFRQMKLSIIDESGNVTRIIKPTTIKFWEIANEIVDEDIAGIMLMHNGQIIDNSKTLAEYFGDVMEAELQVRCVLTPKFASCSDVPFPRISTMRKEEDVLTMHHPPIPRHKLSVMNHHPTRHRMIVKSPSRVSTSGQQDSVDGTGAKIKKTTSKVSMIRKTRTSERKERDKDKAPSPSRPKQSVPEEDVELMSLTNEMFVDVDDYESIGHFTDMFGASEAFIQVLPPVAQPASITHCGTCESMNESYFTSDSESDSSSDSCEFTEDNKFRGRFPLHHAVETGNISMTKLLLKRTSDRDARDEYSRTVLHVAAFLNNVKFIELLVEHGYDIEAREMNGATPLHIATVENSREAAEYLVHHKANVEAQMKDGVTPLMLAVKENHKELAELLLRNGANIEALIATGATPLYKAVQMNNIDMIHTLLIHGANPNGRLKSGTTALFRAVQSRLYDVVRILLSAGARVHDCMDNGTTVLHFAVRMNDIKMTNLLLENGANLNAITITSGSPLHIAAQHDLMEIAECLVARGAEVNSSWLDGTTPLHVASHNKRLKMAAFLTKNNADCNAAKYDGTTPLMIAAKENNINLIKLLLDNGADINACREDGVTALGIAYTLGFDGVVQVLKKYGGQKKIAKNCDLQ